MRLCTSARRSCLWLRALALITAFGPATAGFAQSSPPAPVSALELARYDANGNCTDLTFNNNGDPVDNTQLDD